LAQQTAVRVHEQSILSHSLNRSGIKTQQLNSARKFNRSYDSNVLRGAKFTLHFDYSSCDHDFVTGTKDGVHELFGTTPKVRFSWKKSKNKSKRSFPSRLLIHLSQKIGWFNNGDTHQRIVRITGCTEIRLKTDGRDVVDRIIVRAHPDYRGEGIWMDWIDVCWEQDDGNDDVIVLPAQVIMIIDFDSAQYERIPPHILNLFPFLLNGELGGHHAERTGIYIVIHSAAIPTDEESSTSITTRYLMEDVFQMITLDSVIGITFVARDPMTPGRSPFMYEISQVSKRIDWAYNFIPRNINGWEDWYVNNNDELSDEFDDNVNPWMT